MRISDWSSDVCSSDLTVDWACRAALERLGVATSGEIAAFWDLVTPGVAKAWCLARKGGELEEVRVEGAPDDKGDCKPRAAFVFARSEEHTSELQSLMRISYAVFCLKKKKQTYRQHTQEQPS